jgi:hypothetical protein
MLRAYLELIRWPSFEGCNQRLAQRILCVSNVAGARSDVGDQSSIRITRNSFNRIMRGRLAHVENDFDCGDLRDANRNLALPVQNLDP